MKKSALELLRHNHLKKEIVLSTVSGVLTTKPELIEYFDKNVTSLDIITTKSFQVKQNPGNREPIVCSLKEGDFGNSVGLRNPGLEVALEGVKRIYEKGLRTLLNVSLSASNEEDFITLVKAFDPYSDLLELNYSCPHASSGYGAAIGSDIKIASSFTERIVNETKGRKSLLIVKLTPNVDNIGEIAKAVIEKGADGIAAINTVGPFLYIEKESQTPILNNKLGGRGGASGEWVKAIALEKVKEIRKSIGDDPIILGMGGVSDEMDARAMIRVGADCVGIGSALSRVEMQNYDSYLKAIKDNRRAAVYLSKGNKAEYKKHEILSKEIKDDVIILTLSGSLDCKAGEFVFLWIPGVGEKPFSVAKNNPLTFLIKKRGEFTTSVFSLDVGSFIYTRGLYGKPVKILDTKKAILIAGGSGVAVLPLLAESLKKKSIEMEVYIGLTKKEGLDPLEETLREYGSYLSISDDGKPGRILDYINEETVKGDVSAYIIGPSKMMEVASKKLSFLGLQKDHILISMEKITMCGIGLCGECFAANKLSCKEGTFYTYEELEREGVEF